MGIVIHGPQSSESAQLLRELASQVSCPELHVSWGQLWSGALNSQPRLSAREQMRAMGVQNTRTGGIALVTPVWTETREEAERWVAEGYKVFGREDWHTKGLDIRVPYPATENGLSRVWRGSRWWSKVIEPPFDEWRLHVVRGRCIARGMKVQRMENPTGLEIRNLRAGWRFDHTVELPNGLRPVAKAAVEACGYDFGGVDLIRKTPDDGGQAVVVVLEVNKAVGVDNYTASKYIDAFTRIARGEW